VFARGIKRKRRERRSAFDISKDISSPFTGGTLAIQQTEADKSQRTNERKRRRKYRIGGDL
jgi:hypothetical protein